MGQLILVAPNSTECYQPTQPVPMMTPILGPCGAVNDPPMYMYIMQPALSPLIMHVDPVDVEMAWRCKPGEEATEKSSRNSRTMYLTDQDFVWKVWDRSEINDFINQYCESGVTVSRRNQLWTFTFRLQTDYNKFREWWDKDTDIITLELDNDKPIEHLAAIKRWISDNEIGEHLVHYGFKEMRIRIRNAAECVHFALRWIGEAEID